MKKYIFILIVVVFIPFSHCATWRETLALKGNINDAINNSIVDFTHTSNLSKTDSVFTISVIDINEETIIIGISVPSEVVYPTNKNKVGTFDNKFPTKYIINNSKLFFWNDSTQIITQEIFDILKQYNYIDFSRSELSYILVGGVHNDGVKGVVYYICKNNLKNYKKIGSNALRKHYKPPKLQCE